MVKEMTHAHIAQLDDVQQANEPFERRVAERTQELQESERYLLDIIDSLTASIAVLDSNGTIVSVNKAWRLYSQENNNSSPISDHIGNNYLSVCRASSKSGDEEAEIALTGISSVLQGENNYFSLIYPCHSPDVLRWFQLDVSRFAGSRHGVVISHTDVTARILFEKALQESKEELHQALQAANSANRTMSRLLRTIAHELPTPSGIPCRICQQLKPG